MQAPILAYALDHPTHGALRAAQELWLKGIHVSAGGEHCLWSP